MAGTTAGAAILSTAVTGSDAGPDSTDTL